MTTIIPYSSRDNGSTFADISKPDQYILTGPLTTNDGWPDYFNLTGFVATKSKIRVTISLNTVAYPQVGAGIDFGHGYGIGGPGDPTPNHLITSVRPSPLVFEVSRAGAGYAPLHISAEAFAFTPPPVGASYPYSIVINIQNEDTASPPPQKSPVTIAINDTMTTSDNVVVFNPPALGIPNKPQTILARVTNISRTTQTFQLAVNPSIDGTPYATLSQNSVTLPAQAWAEVTITPKADSLATNDVHIFAISGGTKVAEDSMTIASVTFGTTQAQPSLDIRHTDTPAAMMDRIPPTVNTPLYVSMTPNLTGSGQSITLAVLGQTSLNGTVTLNGSNIPITIVKSGVVSLKGITQTAPADFRDPNNLSAPNARQLFLTATAHGATALQSMGFSVAAIPFNYLVYYYENAPASGKRPYGFTVRNKWQSDSGQDGSNGSLSDLIGVQDLEIVHSYNQTGPFVGQSLETQKTYLDASSFTFSQDDHFWGFGSVKFQAGSATSDQLFVFEDSRTGDANIVITGSGFRITRQVFFDSSQNAWMMSTTEVATSVTIDPLTTQAGTVKDSTNGSSIILTQLVV